ncbi:MAG: DUF4348 domain-containing protein [Chryseolinea sp.]
MKWVLILVGVVSLGCNRSQEIVKNEGSSDSTFQALVQTTSDSISQSDFKDFFERFSTDSVFQLSRIQFPLEVKLWIEEEKPLEKQLWNRGDWKYSSFYYEGEYASRSIDAYTQKVKSYGDTVKLEIRGVDNGIYTDYNFVKVDGDWILVSIRDFTN